MESQSSRRQGDASKLRQIRKSAQTVVACWMCLTVASFASGCGMSEKTRTATLVGAVSGATVLGEAALGAWLDQPQSRGNALSVGVPVGIVVGALAGGAMGYWLTANESAPAASECGPPNEARTRMIEGAVLGAIVLGQLPFLKWAADPDAENRITLQAGIPLFAVGGAVLGGAAGYWLGSREAAQYTDPSAAPGHANCVDPVASGSSS